jgi:hypothetical protein
MKKQTSITQIFLLSIAAVIAIAAASPSRAADPLLATGYIDDDDLEDVAVVTSPTTITVSLGNADGSYTVSAILSAPKRQQITYITLYDRDGDGDLDLIATAPAGAASWYTYIWFGNGDGTFGPRTTEKFSWPKGHHGFF